MESDERVAPRKRNIRRIYDTKSKKRKLDESDRMHGKPYVGYSRKEKTGKPGRKLGPTWPSPFCTKSQKRKCSRFDEVSRNAIFESFWAMDWAAKKVYVREMVSMVARKRPVKKQSRRSSSCIFFL